MHHASRIPVGGIRRTLILLLCLGLGVSTITAQARAIDSWETSGGVEIAWDDTWTQTGTLDGVEEINGFGAFEMVMLEAVDDELCGDGYCGLTVVVYDADVADPREVEAAFVTTSQNGQGSKILLEDSSPDAWWSLVQRWGDSLTVSYTTQIDDEVIVLTLTADRDALLAYAERAEDAIDLDGDDLFGELDLDDLEDAL